MSPSAPNPASDKPPPQLVTPQYLTAAEKQIFQELGLDPAAEVPDNLGEIISQVVPDEEPAEFPGLKLPVKKLTPEQRQEIRKQMLQAREAAMAEGPSMQHYFPQVAQSAHLEHLAKLAREALRDPVQGPSSDSQGQQSGSPHAAQSRTETPASKAPQSEESQPPTEADNSSAETETGNGPFKLCPCCGWNLEHKEIVQVTEQDKTDFMLAWLSGQPFQKSYQLIGGKLVVRFRELSEEDRLEIQRQLSRDLVQEKYPRFHPVGALEAALAKYQFCLQLIEFNAEKQLPITLPDSLEKWEAARREAHRDQETLLEYACSYIFGRLVRFESLKIALYRKVAHFNDLAARLTLLQENDWESF